MDRTSASVNKVSQGEVGGASGRTTLHVQEEPGSRTQATLREPTELLADFPQFPGHGVIFRPGTRCLNGAAGKVTPTQRFNSLLQAAVQCGLSPGLRV